MKPTYNPEDLAKLSDAEQTFVNSIENEAKRQAVACSLIQHRLPDTLKVGDDLPDLTLQAIDGASEHRLRSSCVGDRPLLLVFGSYT